MTKAEIKALEEIERRNKIAKANGWKRGAVEERTELHICADIVIIDRETREVKAKGIWIDIKNIQRLKNLIARENRAWDDTREAVAVVTGSVGMWEILKPEQIISL